MKTLLASAVLVLALACGGGGGGGGTSTPEPPPAGCAGLYFGTVHSTDAGDLTAYAVADAGGEMRYIASAGASPAVNVIGKVQLSGTGGSGSLFDGEDTYSLQLSGVSIDPGSSAQGAFATSSEDSGTFDLTYDSVYDRPQTIASLAGSYEAPWTVTTTGTSVSVTMDTAGNITGHDSAAFTGTLTQPDPSKNLYRVSIRYTVSGNTYSGYGFWADGAVTSGLTANRFYLQVWGENNNTGMGAIFAEVPEK